MVRVPQKKETTKLINPRGRIIEVRINDVEKLIAKGFLRAPEQTHEYNPVFDRMDGEIVPNQVLEELKSGGERKVLMVDRI